MSTEALLPAPTRLRCHDLVEPLGVDAAHPRLSWWDPQTDQHPVAYQLQVADDPGFAEGDASQVWASQVWDSGRMAGQRDPAGVPYAGPELQSLQRLWWRVRVWCVDVAGVERVSAWSKQASWVCGVFAEADWHGAAWIAADEEVAAPRLRRQVTCHPVRRAVLAVCGMGWHELRIDGQRVDDAVLAPAPTAYDRRALYRVLDCTEHLRAGGQHVLGLWLAGGWLRPAVRDVWRRHEQPWRQAPRARLLLRLERHDGSVTLIGSDGDWRWQTGPLAMACPIGGEVFDARDDDGSWCGPTADERDWSPVRRVDPPFAVDAADGAQGGLTAETMPGVRVVDRRDPAAIDEPRPGVFVVDAGRVLSGWLRITVTAAAGTQVHLRYNELLDEDGTLARTHFSKVNPERFQHDELVCSGGVDSYEPRFTYHGFRFVEITGLQRPPRAIEVCEVHSDPPRIGSFACSDPMAERLFALIDHSWLSNLHSVPTDCPQREKNPWLYDSSIAAETAVQRFDLHRLLAKWVDDMCDAQEKDGHVPACCPPMAIVRGHGDGRYPLWSDPWFGSAIIRVPWMLYRHHGDRAVLARAYPAMQAHCRQLQKRADENGGIVDWGLGDWLEPGNWQGFPRLTPIPLTATIGLIDAWEGLGRVATALGDQAMVNEATRTAHRVRRLWRRTFLAADGALPEAGRMGIASWRPVWTRADGCAVDQPSQTAAAMTLAYGMCDPEARPRVLEQLRAAIARADGHLQVGFHGIVHIFEVLCDAGLVDEAWSLLTVPGMPGFRHMIDSGATGLWECWSGVQRVGDHAGMSHNHPTWGVVGAWLTKRIGGIAPDTDTPGYRAIRLRPVFPSAVDHAAVTLDTPLGLATSRWRRVDATIIWNIELPSGSTGLVELIQDFGDTPAQLAAGEHEIRLCPATVTT